MSAKVILFPASRIVRRPPAAPPDPDVGRLALELAFALVPPAREKKPRKPKR
jgi:hypothetical protein